MPAIEPPQKKVKEFTPLAVRKPSRKNPRRLILARMPHSWLSFNCMATSVFICSISC